MELWLRLVWVGVVQLNNDNREEDKEISARKKEKICESSIPENHTKLLRRQTLQTIKKRLKKIENIV